MAINNVDIYGDEWLELVFENRNKSYGAYDLRKHYAATVLKALGVTFGSITTVFVVLYILFKPAPIAADPIKHETVATLNSYVVTSTTAIVPGKHTHHHTRNGHPYSPAQVVTVQAHTTVPVNTATIQSVPETGNTQTVIVAAAEDKTVYPVANADIKPQPTGALQGWATYLQHNLVYPEDARHKKIEGKVQLSFIVEKDGSLSDITVDRSAGHGFDEEAVRVLEQSPQWQPGIKDGQAIRIRYTLPISFKMAK